MNYIDTSFNNPSFSSSHDVAEITKPLKKLGITYFTYTRVERNGGRTYLTNAPEVLEGYFKGNYYLKGNTEGCPLHHKSQIVLWDTLPNQNILDENARAKNYDHGMFIIKPGIDYCDFFGFATTKGNDHIINTYLTKLDFIKSFTEYFTDEAKDVIKTVSAKKIILPFSNYVIDCTANDIEADESIFLQYQQAKSKLTAKQFSIAKKFVDGMKIKAIAKEMKLSPRTVEQHINTLKSKFDCSTAINLAVKLSKFIYN